MKGREYRFNYVAIFVVPCTHSCQEIFLSKAATKQRQEKGRVGGEKMSPGMAAGGRAALAPAAVIPKRSSFTQGCTNTKTTLKARSIISHPQLGDNPVWERLRNPGVLQI